MVIVRFNDWEEFMAELKEHRPADSIARLTLSIRYDGRATAYLTMVAGYVADGTIIEFVHYLGLSPQDPRSTRAQEIKTLLEERKKLLEAQGLTVKSGRYHVPPQQTR
jgi:hypothetical protein